MLCITEVVEAYVYGVAIELPNFFTFSLGEWDGKGTSRISRMWPHGDEAV